MARDLEEQPEEIGSRIRRNKTQQEEAKEAEEVGEEEAEGAGITMTIITTPIAVVLEEVDPSLIEGTEIEKENNKIGRTTKLKEREKEKGKTKATILQSMTPERVTWRTRRELGVLQEGIDPQEMRGDIRDRRGENRAQIDGNRHQKEEAEENIVLIEGER